MRGSHWATWTRPAPTDLEPTPENIVKALEWAAAKPKPPPVTPTLPLYGCLPFARTTTCSCIHTDDLTPGTMDYCECCGRHGMDGLHPAVPLGVQPLPDDPKPVPPPVPKFKPKQRRKRNRELILA